MTNPKAFSPQRSAGHVTSDFPQDSRVLTHLAQTVNDMQFGKRFLFVGGMHRSGTTALWECFRSHPSISGFANVNNCKDEGQFEQTIYPIDKYYGHTDWPMHPDVNLNETSTLVNETNRRNLTQQWYRHWDLSKPVLLEKTPRNLVISRFLQAMFPESSFLFVIRHPVAQAKALQRIGWSHRTIEELIERWIKAHDMLRTDQPFLRHSILLRYEDFVRQPQLFYRILCNRLNLPYSDLQLKIRPNEDDKYRISWERELSQLHVASLRAKNLWLLEEEVRRLGYSLFNWNFAPDCNDKSLNFIAPDGQSAS
jgi:Sulfotransferase family